MLNVHGRTALVVGGGAVALRRTRSLCRAGAQVTLVAPDVAGAVDPAVAVRRETYRPEMLAGAFVVLACTDDRALNAEIARDARRTGALVNAADQPEDCDFYLPAVARDGPVQVAVGTSGAAPGLAGRLRDSLSAALPTRIGEFAKVLSELREELRSAVPDTGRRGRIMKALAGEETYQAFLAGGPEVVRRKLNELIGP